MIPSSFRIARMLLDRVEDSDTGEVLIPEMHVPITEEVRAQSDALIDLLGDTVWDDLPVVDGMQPQTPGAAEMMLNMNWRPCMSVIGADGMPPIQTAGNVLRTNTDLKLSFRVPPGADSEAAISEVKRILEEDPPYGAKVTFTPDAVSDGFRAPSLSPGAEKALSDAAIAISGLPPMTIWLGGTIPFLAMMQESYPAARFLVTGCGGPGNNAHGPDEKLHIPTVKHLTQCVAAAIASMSN